MTSYRLTLLPIGLPAHQKSVSETLTRLGYATELASPKRLFETNRNTGDLLVLLIGRDELPYEPLDLYLSSQTMYPSLGVVDIGVKRLSKRIFDRLSELAFWPCNEFELHTRLQRLNLEKDTHSLASARLAEEFLSFNLIGRSPRFLETLSRIKKIAACEAPVVIEGETGTGKELAARAIHYLSARKAYPFIPVNCGALPDSLIENELFGHTQGAYTDAKRGQRGVVAQAEGGTLFLDEVDSLSPKAQVTLLRFLQDQSYHPLGSEQLRQGDVRIVAASQRSLAELIDKGSFRQDLFFRLAIVTVDMPPLRAREGDAVLLANRFVDVFRRRYDQPGKVIHPSMLNWIKSHDWPGNVRELENLIHRQFLLADDASIGNDYLRKARATCRRRHDDRRKKYSSDLGFSEAKARTVAEFEKRYLTWLMQKTNGNVTQAARHAGKERRALGKLLKKHAIDPNNYASR